MNRGDAGSISVRPYVVSCHYGQTDAFAQPRIGTGKGRRLRHRVVTDCQRLDMGRINVTAAPDDHVFQAAGDAQIAGGVDTARMDRWSAKESGAEHEGELFDRLHPDYAIGDSRRVFRRALAPGGRPKLPLNRPFQRAQETTQLGRKPTFTSAACARVLVP